MLPITLYSNDCPRCNVLQTKLDMKGIPYKKINDIKQMISLGFRSAPLLGIGNEIMEFSSAVKWVNSQPGMVTA